MNVVSYAQIALKSIFSGLDQPMRIRIHNVLIQRMYIGCSLVRFLWEICLFHLEGGTIPPYCVLQFFPFISIGVNRLCISIGFLLNKTLTKKYEIFVFTCIPCDH